METQKMTYDELVRKILAICPMALFSSNDNGEIKVSTGWIETGGPDVPLQPLDLIEED